MERYHRALTIAGSDSGGGAGIQADLKTFAALGCYGMSVITALTAQNTVAVKSIHPVPPEFIAEQIDAVMEDIGVDAVKIGMLHSTDVIETVAERLRHYNINTIVLDPVMVAQSGDKLLRDDAIEALKATLIPLATVITPNIPEASVLLGHPVETAADMEAASRELGALGAAAVLLKGGHLKDEQSVDFLTIKDDDSLHKFEAERIDTKNTHGTGCTLSSAIAGHLARDYSIFESVRRAKDYITNALRHGAEHELGQGHGPVHHFYNLWH